MYDTPDTRGWVDATDRVGAPNEYPTASDLRIRIGEDPHATERPEERVDVMNICLGLPASTVARPAYAFAPAGPPCPIHPADPAEPSAPTGAPGTTTVR
jgi:hypothetical protein